MLGYVATVSCFDEFVCLRFDLRSCEGVRYESFALNIPSYIQLPRPTKLSPLRRIMTTSYHVTSHPRSERGDRIRVSRSLCVMCRHVPLKYSPFAVVLCRISAKWRIWLQNAEGHINKGMLLRFSARRGNRTKGNRGQNVGFSQFRGKRGGPQRG